MNNWMRLRGVVAAAVVAAALGRAVAGDFQISHHQSFNLGPGETQFGLIFPKFNPDAYGVPVTLTEVVVELDATFSAGIALDSANGSVQWSLGPARAEAVGSAGLAIPAATSQTLSGQTTVPAGQTVVVTPTPSQRQTTTASVSSPNLGPYLWSEGSPSVSYDVDFSALYTVVSTVPSTAAGLFWSDRMTGTLTVRYRGTSPAPTGVVLQALGASWLEPGLVRVDWRTGMESNLIGFLLDRRLGDGEWARVTAAAIPAIGGGQGTSYAYTDSVPETATAIAYRLSQVTIFGEVSPLGETAVVQAPVAGLAVRGGNLELSVTGQPQARVTAQTTANVASGPWVTLDSLVLDSAGRGSLLFPLSEDEPARFYRVLVE